MKELFKNNEELLQIQQKRLNFISESYFKENKKAKMYIGTYDDLETAIKARKNGEEMIKKMKGLNNE